MFSICASTPENSVVVVREDPVAALSKMDEFAELGLTEIAVTNASGQAFSRDQLQRLAADEPVAA